MNWWLYRFRVRWQMWRNLSSYLNRRVEVENILMSVATGKRPLLTKQECLQLAYKLGIPPR